MPDAPWNHDHTEPVGYVDLGHAEATEQALAAKKKLAALKAKYAHPGGLKKASDGLTGLDTAVAETFGLMQEQVGKIAAALTAHYQAEGTLPPGVTVAWDGGKTDDTVVVHHTANPAPTTSPWLNKDYLDKLITAYTKPPGWSTMLCPACGSGGAHESWCPEVEPMPAAALGCTCPNTKGPHFLECATMQAQAEPPATYTLTTPCACGCGAPAVLHDQLCPPGAHTTADHQPLDTVKVAPGTLLIGKLINDQVVSQAEFHADYGMDPPKPWADPDHDVLGDIKAAYEALKKPQTHTITFDLDAGSISPELVSLITGQPVPPVETVSTAPGDLFSDTEEQPPPSGPAPSSRLWCTAHGEHWDDPEHTDMGMLMISTCQAAGYVRDSLPHEEKAWLRRRAELGL